MQKKYLSNNRLNNLFSAVRLCPVEVLGTDGGRPQRVSTATVTLSVVNNNDKSPELTPHTQRTQVGPE